MKAPHVCRFILPRSNGSEYIEGRCKCGARKTFRDWPTDPMVSYRAQIGKGKAK